MLSLPTPDGGVPSLNDVVYARLRRKHPGVLPSKPLGQSGSDCSTCGGKLTFRWFTDLQASIVPVAVETPTLTPGESVTTYSVGDVPEVGEYECPCWLQSRIQAYLLAHNVGKNAARSHWGDTSWVPPHLLAPLREFGDSAAEQVSRGMGLFLWGMYGSGKSLIANLILKRCLAAGAEGHWITFNEMLSMHTNSWRDAEAREWFETRVRNAQVLVIDDIGKEASFQSVDEDGKVRPSNWGSIVSTALDSLFRSRVQNGLLTIITANMSPDDVAKHYTPALGSLAVEGCLPYEFPAQDVRRLYVERTMTEQRLGLTRPFTFS